MLTRRALFRTASALCVSMANLKRVSAAGPKPNTTVAFDVPRGACDAHVHVVGERKEFTMSPERDYTPPAATADDLVEMLKFLNIERAVIVTPTVYGNDNSVTLAAIEKLGRDRARRCLGRRDHLVGEARFNDEGGHHRHSAVPR